MRVVFAVLALLAVAASAKPLLSGDISDRKVAEQMFEDWRQFYNLEFANGVEYVQRLDIFINNHMMIESHNALSLDWTMSHNEYSHMSWEEFREQKLGWGSVPKNSEAESVFDDSQHVGALPESVDWRTKGAVSEVKNQGQCGSCWAFSTVGALEGAYFLSANSHNLTEFSEQQLVDCDKGYGDQGCSGGLMDNAFKFIKNNGGLCKEGDYAYVGHGENCMKKCDVVPDSAVKSWSDVRATTRSLAAALAKQPVAVAIEADQTGFQFYSGGVFTGDCGTNLDHGVLAVGYGTEDGTDYWLVKNSWGPTWGSEGFIKLVKGKNQAGGQCGILESASFPTLVQTKN